LIKLVLLPGMDGTGELFEPFLEAVRIPTQVVRYPGSDVLGYAELEALVMAELPTDQPYVLLGESFSGPIAIAVASKQPRQLRGVVLCCSFAKNPRPAVAPLRRLINLLPSRPPLPILEYFLSGRFATPALRDALSRALAQVSPAVLRSRMNAVACTNVVEMLRSIAVPVLYLRASEDRLVPPTASRLVLENVPHARLVELVAPHFLLQTAPKEAAELVEEFMREPANAL
jgi:pimeloyl-[acyl-carrier protein] methyl ester esterase